MSDTIPTSLPAPTDGPQLRRMAAALLNAADEWDRITGASS
jgi:hypothetical protein